MRKGQERESCQGREGDGHTCLIAFPFCCFSAKCRLYQLVGSLPYFSDNAGGFTLI